MEWWYWRGGDDNIYCFIDTIHAPLYPGYSPRTPDMMWRVTLRGSRENSNGSRIVLAVQGTTARVWGVWTVNVQVLCNGMSSNTSNDSGKVVGYINQSGCTISGHLIIHTCHIILLVDTHRDKRAPITKTRNKLHFSLFFFFFFFFF